MLASEPISDNEPYRDDDSALQPLFTERGRRRLLWLLALACVVAALIFVPPLFRVDFLHRRIEGNISRALGRPVHFDRVNLTILPIPGFTLSNFVVDEDPHFGAEPILRADEVHASVRLSSLFRSHTEFSTISLTDAHINLVRTADGSWNLGGILFDASKIEAAPTAQPYAGPAARFPYIEATGARINLKLGNEKTPFSLTDADLALWLPEPRQWHFRVEAKPSRTDVAPLDAGTLQVEGTLGGGTAAARTLGEIPITLEGQLRDAELVGLERMVLGHDAGLRGEVRAHLKVTGTMGEALIATNVQLANGRRADFIPGKLVNIDLGCRATARNTFHAFTAIECHWPPAETSDRSVAIATAEVPNLEQPALSHATVTLPALPTATLMEWLGAATQHSPSGVLSSGTLAGELSFAPTRDGFSWQGWSGDLELTGGALRLGAERDPVELGDIVLRRIAADGKAKPVAKNEAPAGFDLQPVTITLAPRQSVTLEGHFDAAGATLHLTGNASEARLLELGDAIPQLGEGLRALLAPDSLAPADAKDSPDQKPHAAKVAAAADPDSPEPDGAVTHIDLTATRPWGQPQRWTQTAPAHKPARSTTGASTPAT